MSADVPTEISRLVDRWCERRALHALRMILPFWPPPNGFTDEWQDLWAAMRHIRAMYRDDLAQHEESAAVNSVIAQLSQRLFPAAQTEDLEQSANRLIASIFKDPGSSSKRAD